MFSENLLPLMSSDEKHLLLLLFYHHLSDTAVLHMELMLISLLTFSAKAPYGLPKFMHGRCINDKSRNQYVGEQCSFAFAGSFVLIIHKQFTVEKATRLLIVKGFLTVPL